MNMRNDCGVLYFNSGYRCLARLVVSIYSLRRHYRGPVTIVTCGTKSNEFLQRTVSRSDPLRVELVEATFPDIPAGDNEILLQKTAVARFSPYQRTVFLDSDTLVRGRIDELFALADRFGFVVPQFADWTTDQGLIRRRISAWHEQYPDWIEPALQFGPALNCGVFAFHRESEFIRQWTRIAMPGRHLFIPDETAMQVALHRFPHHVADQKFNVSCKHSDPDDPDARVIHYHGHKHCRLDATRRPLHAAELWLHAFEQVRRRGIWEIESWMPHGDRYLKRYLKSRRQQRRNRSHSV